MSKEALVEDIREDIRVAQRSLEREGYEKWKGDEWLVGEKGGERIVARERGYGAAPGGGVAKCEMMP